MKLYIHTDYPHACVNRLNPRAMLEKARERLVWSSTGRCKSFQNCPILKHQGLNPLVKNLKMLPRLDPKRRRFCSSLRHPNFRKDRCKKLSGELCMHSEWKVLGFWPGACFTSCIRSSLRSHRRHGCSVNRQKRHLKERLSPMHQRFTVFCPASKTSR